MERQNCAGWFDAATLALMKMEKQHKNTVPLSIFFARKQIDLLLFWRLGSLTIQFRDVYGTLEPPTNINVFLLNPLFCADETTGNFLAIKLSARGRTVKMQSMPCTSVINRFQLRVQCDSH